MYKITLLSYILQVWITILDDLPYALVLDRIEFIVEHKNLIANVDIVRKVVAILPNVGRAVNAKIHPIKVRYT